MAKLLKEPLADNARPTKYPWAEWFDGKPRELTRGKDFQQHPDPFHATAIGAARRYNVRLRTRVVDDDTVQLQAVKK